MCLKDTFYTISTAMIAREHATVAGVFDALGDIATLLSVGIGAVNIYHFGILAARSLLLYLAVVIGSFGGTAIGVKFGSRINRNMAANKDE